MATKKTKSPGTAGQAPVGGGLGGRGADHLHLPQGDGCGTVETPPGAGFEGGPESLPEGAVLGAGCGYPLGDVEVPEGATVLDLGCGGGLDCFQGFRRVQDDGLLIGEDLTEASLERQRIAQRAAVYQTAKFQRGGQDRLPVDDMSVDLVVSNCVLNLVGDRARAYTEIHRVLRPGGRAAISDVVTRGTLSPEVRRDIQSYVGCVARAIDREAYLQIVRAAGFREVAVTRSQEFAVGSSPEGAALNITVVATR
jgi:SAM-dependent methyltransferase